MTNKNIETDLTKRVARNNEGISTGSMWKWEREPIRHIFILRELKKLFYQTDQTKEERADRPNYVSK